MSEQQILALLGEPLPVEGETSPSLVLADRVEKGFHRRAVDRVKAALGVSDAEMAQVLGISQKTISRLRKKTTARLGAAASDRLYRVAALFALAVQVLGDEEAARTWLHAEQMALGGRRPLDLARTEVGAREVERLLGRLEYGVLA